MSEQSEATVDPRMLLEILGMLILRSGSETVSFTRAEHRELRRQFPHGFGLLGLGRGPDEDGEYAVRMVGPEARALLERVADELDDGQLTTLRRLFGSLAAEETGGEEAD